MRKEENYNDQSAENVQMNDGTTVANETGSAFEYLKSLPKNFDRPALDSYKRNRTSAIIDYQIAEDFTGNFRGIEVPFYIPVSWSMTKSALVNLLGITSYEGYNQVNGIRFYAGINDDNQLTLIAVSTEEGIDCDDDLTVNDSYPYYDYANPCPNSCSSRGNLKALSPIQTKVAIVTE